MCGRPRRHGTAHGTVTALDYLLGEKLLRYAETAVARREFARELPRFVAEIRDMFEPSDIRTYLESLEHIEFDVGNRCGQGARAQRRERFRLLKELLLAERLGTS